MQEIFDCTMSKSWILWVLGLAGTSVATGFYVTILLDYFTLGVR